MKTLLALALCAIGSAHAAACSWDNPGSNPTAADPIVVLHNVALASHMPADVEARFAEKLRANAYDDFVLITRNSVNGAVRYSPTIEHMSSGNGHVCTGPVSRAWSTEHEESALVYHVDGWAQDLMVAIVCRNMAALTRERVHAVIPPAEEAFGGGGGGSGLVLPPYLPAPLVAAPPPAVIVVETHNVPPLWMGPDRVSWVVLTAPPAVPIKPPDNWAYVPPRPGDWGGPVPVAPVPEPSTWAMMLAGLGFLAWRRAK